jgi:hypothetical protein
MGMPLRLYSLSGDFKIVRTVEVKTIPEARAAVEAHIAGSGYTNLRGGDYMEITDQLTDTERLKLQTRAETLRGGR